MNPIKVIVLTGDGINCERETAFAFSSLNAKADCIHINELRQNLQLLKDYDILALPGGFSFGDELGSGNILSNKLSLELQEVLHDFIKEKKLVIGICNGFQVLVRSLLKTEKDIEFGLVPNKNKKFINKWTPCKIEESHCHWTKEMAGDIQLPIRHAEGNFQFSNISNAKHIYESWLNSGRIVLRYQNDENGSFENIAGITDPSGQILGLMPHPEAANRKSINPFGEHQLVQKFFSNAINYSLKRREQNA